MSKGKRKRGSCNSRKVLAGLRRRTQRCAERGREFEEFFSELLRKMSEEDMILSFEKHPPHSPKDQSGMDFTVSKTVHGESIERSFGITTSHASMKRARVRYPSVPQFHFPMETKPETMQKRVLGLFNQ